MIESHNCKPGYNLEKEEHVFQSGDYGPAIDYCTEDEKGYLWCGNSEYRTRVNFCPFCGYKAEEQIELGKRALLFPRLWWHYYKILRQRYSSYRSGLWASALARLSLRV